MIKEIIKCEKVGEKKFKLEVSLMNYSGENIVVKIEERKERAGVFTCSVVIRIHPSDKNNDDQPISVTEIGNEAFSYLINKSEYRVQATAENWRL